MAYGIYLARPEFSSRGTMRGKSVGSSVRIGLIGGAIGFVAGAGRKWAAGQTPDRSLLCGAEARGATTAGGARIIWSARAVANGIVWSAGADDFGERATGERRLGIAGCGCRYAGRVLFEENADKFFVPASNMKLFTTALALCEAGSGIPVSHDD